MLKCGLLDHHLHNFHAGKFIGLLHGELAEMDVRVAYAYESSPTGEGDWCGDHDVERCQSAEEVVEKSDAIMVMAPNDVGEHLALGRVAYQSGKRVYVDKYLANKYADAEGIVSLCKANRTPLLSASALRFAVELEEALAGNAGDVSAMFARGPNNWPGYACHTLAPVLRVMGWDIERIINTGTEDISIVTLVYRDGRNALVEVREGDNAGEVLNWQFGLKREDKYAAFGVADYDGFYRNLMVHVAGWLKGGETDVTTDEMLTTVWVLDAALGSRRAKGKWLSPTDVG